MRNSRSPVGALGVPVLSGNKMSSLITAFRRPHAELRLSCAESLLERGHAWQEASPGSQLQDRMSSPTPVDTANHRQSSRGWGRGRWGRKSHQEKCRVVSFQMGMITLLRKFLTESGVNAAGMYEAKGVHRQRMCLQETTGHRGSPRIILTEGSRL